MNHTVNTTEAKKVSVTITREQLWYNYVDCWRDIAWDRRDIAWDTNAMDTNAIAIGVDSLKTVHGVLVTGGDLDFVKLRKLFRDGETVMLMNDAMQFLDNGADILREIIVVDCNGKNVTIRHEDISF